MPDDLPVDPEDEPETDLPPDPAGESEGESEEERATSASESRREGARELTADEHEFCVALARDGCTGYGRQLNDLFRRYFPGRCNVGPQQFRKNTHALFNRPNIQAELTRQLLIEQQRKANMDAARAAIDAAPVNAMFDEAKVIEKVKVATLEGFLSTLEKATKGVREDEKGNVRVPAGLVKLYELGLRASKIMEGDSTVKVNVGGEAEELTERARRELGQKVVSPVGNPEGKA